MKISDKAFLLETCVLSGRILLENGAEMSRIEDTMNRIANSCQGEKGISFVTQVIVMMSLESTKEVQMAEVKKRTIDLEKIAKVNDYSRRFANKEISIKELQNLLFILDVKINKRPEWLKMLSAAVVSACLIILLGGEWSDFFPTLFVSGLSYSVYLLSQKYLQTKYLEEFITSFTIGVLAIVFVKIGISDSVDKMIIGSIMPLVPGIAITNAIRDLQQYHMLSGVLRAVEALIVAAMIASGIAAAFYWLY